MSAAIPRQGSNAREVSPVSSAGRSRRVSVARACTLPCALLASCLLAGAAAAQPLVALIDSGVDAGHPALAGRIVAGYDFVNDDSLADDRLGHGTGMAGVIAARGMVEGVCPTCLIMPLKVAGPAGPGEGGLVTSRRLARAIDYAVEHAARVILIGAGFTGCDAAVANAIARAEASGIPVIAPAGSLGPRRMLYPAALPTVIAAAAAEDVAPPHEAVIAAGGNVRVLAPGGRTVMRSGSSIAAARVAGVVARALQSSPGLSTAQVRRMLGLGPAPELVAGRRGAQEHVARSPALGGAGDRTDDEGDTDFTSGGGGGDLGQLQYADRAGTDVVMDAPWKTVRDYVPVLFFFPQFEGGRRVERIRLFDCVAGVPAGPPVVVDQVSGPDTLNGATFIGPLGEARDGLAAGERVGNFWHYVMRVPHAALGHHGTPDVHYLYAEVEWSRRVLLWRQRLSSHRVLRVLVEPRQFPSFDAADRYLDTHVHTIAEQSTSGVLDVNGASKAFGGPVVMLLESAYALGLVQTPPRDGNWADYRDSVAVTDHNIFYSTRPYDTGVLPGAGPTSTLADGHAAEAAWYRANLGRLAGEEISLRRGSNQDDSIQPNIGHHLLAYGTRHFEGPWHGGLFLTSGLENPNTLESVLAGMKAAGAGGFAYASHPALEGFIWPPEYFAQAIGFPPYDSKTGPTVDSAGTEFLFKGSEVWNIKADEVAAASGHLPASSAFDRMNPFAGGPDAQRFARKAWDGELLRSLDTTLAQLGRGLRFSFREAPQERFIRKLYMSAGSDAHGDFDYTDEVSATAVPYSGALTSNAYARVRTYALAHDRPPGEHSALDAFRHGNTVLTDGPLVRYALDADGRHDPEAGAARWHDAESRWENGEGRIGGAGRFDGGRTMLVPLPGGEVWIRSEWMRSATPGAGEVTRYKVDRVMESARDSFDVPAGHDGTPDERRLPQAMDRLAALVLTARDPSVDERCIVNPVWVAPVRIEVQTPPGEEGAPQPAALPPGSLKVVFHFPISMSAGAATRVCLRPLDSAGNSTDPEVELTPDPGWEEEDGVAGGRYSATNAGSIPCVTGDWDAESHASVPGVRSFVVYLRSPADVHGNVLNDVGRAFAVPAAQVTNPEHR